jgi:hypothetical protein
VLWLRQRRLGSGEETIRVSELSDLNEKGEEISLLIFIHSPPTTATINKRTQIAARSKIPSHTAAYRELLSDMDRTEGDK